MIPQASAVTQTLGLIIKIKIRFTVKELILRIVFNMLSLIIFLYTIITLCFSLMLNPSAPLAPWQREC